MLRAVAMTWSTRPGMAAAVDAFDRPWFAIGDDTRQRGPGLKAGAIGTGRKTRICPQDPAGNLVHRH